MASKKTRFQLKHKFSSLNKKHKQTLLYRHFKLRFESLQKHKQPPEIDQSSKVQLLCLLKISDSCGYTSHTLKTINFTDLISVKLNKALICKSIFWFMKSYPLLLIVDSHWLWQNKISCFPKRDLIELKNIHYDPHLKTELSAIRLKK